ncbi:MAG TPA: hypothetical protein VL281_02440 [Mycobacteriales bacterium]|jgi:hypothetical protein|nr:hypothetical protein [Mycobacteriales bacterium]
MFMQIVQGKIKDRAAAKATMDRWLAEVEPGAEGWLGGTYGVTDEGQLVACVRFRDHAAAQANSSRPEQSAWWREMEQHFEGPVTFHDCEDVSLLLGGGSDEAQFVQVIQARVTDRDRLHRLMDESSSLLAQYRPDVLGGTIAIDDDGLVTETIAFTSEAAARSAEQQELPAEAQEAMSLLTDVQYLDLHDPWFATAKKQGRR